MRGFVGDADIDTTYAAVGRALSAWEGVELRLAEVYSIFTIEKMDLELVRDYGSANQTFRWRIAAIEKAAKQYFIRKPCQDYEGDFLKMTALATDLAEGRNNIAHGIVRPCRYHHRPGTNPPEECDVTLFILTPPWYSIERLRLLHSGDMGSSEMLDLADKFAQLAADVNEYGLRLLPLAQR